MNTKEIIAMTEAHYLPVFGRFPIAIDHGEGATLYGCDTGKKVNIGLAVRII